MEKTHRTLATRGAVPFCATVIRLTFINVACAFCKTILEQFAHFRFSTNEGQGFAGKLSVRFACDKLCVVVPSKSASYPFKVVFMSSLIVMTQIVSAEVRHNL